MKKSAFLFIFSLCLLACEPNKGQTAAADTNTGSNVQHDTVMTDRTVPVKNDSIISNGEYIQHYKNGVAKMRGTMKNGKRDGLWKSFYENGAPWSETTFTDGKKNGPTTTWYENEKKRYTGFYTKDAESGQWTFWNDKGEKVQDMNYDQK